MTAAALAVLLPLTANAQETVLQKNSGAVLVDAVASYDEGDFADAKARLTSILDSDPLNDAAYYYLGLCFMQERDLKSSEKFFSEAVKLDSNNFWYMEALGRVYAGQGKAEPAITMYKHLIRKFPKKADPYYTLSNIYARLNQYDKMYGMLETINEKFGGSPEILTTMGDYQMNSGNDTLALQYYNEALLHDPQSPTALLGAAEIKRYRGEYPEFFKNMGEFVSMVFIRPQAKVEYLGNMFRRLSVGELPKHMRDFDALMDTLLVVHPRDTSVVPFVASYYFATERKDRCLELNRDFARAFPDDHKAQVSYIQTLWLTGDLSGAAGEAELCSRKFRDNDIFPQMLGDIYHQLGDSRKAYKSYERALKINPKNYGVLNNYAYYLSLEKKNLSKALKMSAKATKAEPDNATYLDTHGWILHLMGRSAQAKPVFKHAMLYGGKESAVVMEHYAEVLETLGENDLAEVYRNLAKNKAKDE